MDDFMYHVRITSTEERFSRMYIQSFKKYFQVMEEEDDEVNRTHTHSHLEEPMLKIKSIRNKLSTMTDKNKNKMFSMTVVRDRKKNLLYLCKGKSQTDLPVVVINNLLTEEQIKEYHAEYWETNKKLKEGSVKPKKKITFLECCIKEACKPDYKTIWESGFEYITNHQKRAMFSLVTRMLGEQRKILDAMIIRRLCNGVFNVILPFKYRDDMLFDQVYGDNTRLE